MESLQNGPERQPSPSDVSDAVHVLRERGVSGNTTELSDLAYRVAAGKITVEDASKYLD